jgi:putative oxidoreductase
VSAPPRRIVSSLDAVSQALNRVPLSLLQLLMRVGVGAVFFNAGLLKYRSWELTLLLFRDEYKVPLFDPALIARIATFNELISSTLLFLGLATRLATLPFLGMIVVIQIFVYPNAWVEHLVWTSILLFLLTRGAGALSLDCVIERRFGRSGRNLAPSSRTDIRSGGALSPLAHKFKEEMRWRRIQHLHARQREGLSAPS